MDKVLIYTDGGARGNPGISGAGGVIYDSNKQVLGEVSKFLGTQTNNWAEYEALILTLALTLELKLEARPVEVFLDSKLVVEQVLGNWKVKEPTLKPKVKQAQELVAKFKDIKLAHIPREENKVADALANLAMDKGE